MYHIWYIIINLDNGLTPNKRQTIIQTNCDPCLQRVYALLYQKELMG